MDPNKEFVQKMNEKIIGNYKNDEKMMVLIFVQWCVNNNVDAIKLYEEAYPEQGKNKLLLEMLEETVDKDTSENIYDETVLNVLQMFGNDDLAFAVQRIIDKKMSSK